MKNKKRTELIEEYVKTYAYVDNMCYLIKNRIPYEKWPEEFRAIAGINEELLGAADDGIEYLIRD